MHLVNTFGFIEKRPAIVPQDGKNLNRVFPGNEAGSFSEKLAYYITEQLHKNIDFYMDLHGGDLHEDLIAYAYYPGIAEEAVVLASQKAAQVLEVPYIVKSSAKTGAYNSAAILGVPSLLLERGGSGIYSQQEVKLYKRDVYRLLNHLGTLKIEKPVINEKQTEITQVYYIEAPVEGCWYPKVSVGEHIATGQILGVICDLFGTKLETVYAKGDGIILYMTISLAIQQGESVVAYGII
jgi:predicted deacylase